MMKRKVFMPLLMASIMMGVVAIHSCTKNEDEAIKSISAKALYESMDEVAPMMENEVNSDRDDVGSWVCPYCSIPLYHNDTHWHYFGTPASMKPPFGDDPNGFDVNEMMEMDRPIGSDGNVHPHFWGVSDCLNGMSDESCPYSGALEGSEPMIQLLMNELHVSHQIAEWMLLPRFHAHKMKYKAFQSEGEYGGQYNIFHVGGGVPGWPTPDIVVP